MDNLIQILDVLKWPLVAIIVSIVAILRFTPNIGNLIDRIKKISKEGIETEKVNQQTHPQKKISAKELLKLFNNKLIQEVEERLQSEFEKIEHTPEEKEQLLMKRYASEVIAHVFDQIYNYIFGSQISALHYLNTHVGKLVDLNEVKLYYEEAKTKYPLLYNKYLFDNWLGYLENNVLILREGSNIGITIRGQEFLKYLISMGLTSNKFG